VSVAAPYELLAELAERELGLVSAFEPGSAEDLFALARERDALVATLPSAPPVEAQPALARASYLQARTTATLATLCAGVARSLGDVERAHRAARGYGGGIPRRRGLERTG
jgi:hypothetical protein